MLLLLLICDGGSQEYTNIYRRQFTKKERERKFVVSVFAILMCYVCTRVRAFSRPHNNDDVAR